MFAVIDVARDAAMFGLMVGAGLRVEEGANIRITDLDTPTSADQLIRLRVRGNANRASQSMRRSVCIYDTNTKNFSVISLL